LAISYTLWKNWDLTTINICGDLMMIYHLVMTNIAMEIMAHENRWFTGLPIKKW
jgi:hypothetical protein